MPFENNDSTQTKSEPKSQGFDLNLVGIHSEKSESANSAQTNTKSDGGMPTGRLVGLAGTTAGLAELTMNHIGTNAGKLFRDSADTLIHTAHTGGAGLYNSLDKLRVHQATSIFNGIYTETGPLSAAANKEVGHVINYGIDVTESMRARVGAASAMTDSAVKSAAATLRLNMQFDDLAKAATSRAQMLEIMANDRRILSHGATKLQNPMTSAELRKFGELAFNKGSLVGEGMIQKAATMTAAEKVAPSTVLETVFPSWRNQLEKLTADEAKFGRMGSQLNALKNPSGADLAGGLLKMRHLEQPLFQQGEAITAALNEHAMNTRYMQGIETKLASDQRLLTQHATTLRNNMSAELAVSSNAQSFAKGFGKGAVVMSAAIGAGLVIDKMMDRENLSISSPLGMGIDAAAGLTLMSKLPTHVKVPLAVATLAAPRIMDANGYGDILRPAALQGDSAWRPNAVDAIGLGLAAGLNVDGRIRLGIGAATIVAGRAYHIMNAPKENQLPELDMSKFKIQSTNR